MKGKSITTIKPRFNDSLCRKNILKVRETYYDGYYDGRKIELNNGNMCRFWPNNIWQAVAWLHAFFSVGEKLYMVIIAGICW